MCVCALELLQTLVSLSGKVTCVDCLPYGSVLRIQLPIIKLAPWWDKGTFYPLWRIFNSEEGHRPYAAEDRDPYV